MKKPNVIDSVKVCGNCQRWVVEPEGEGMVEVCCLTGEGKQPHMPGCEHHALICYLDPKWFGIKK